MNDDEHLKKRILTLLNYSKYVLTFDEIQYILNESKTQMDRVMFELQNTDSILLRNGFYRSSEKSKREL